MFKCTADEIAIKDLTIDDLEIVSFFNQIQEDDQEILQAERKRALLRALRIGVLALHNTQTRVDIEVVRSEFEKLQRQIETTLKQTFDSDTGKMELVLKAYLGSGGKLEDLFDPDRRDSAIGQIKNIFDEHFSGDGAKLRGLLDYTESNSPLKKLYDALEKQFVELSAILQEWRGEEAEKRGRQVESEKGTSKGNIFETNLYNRVAEMANNLEDVPENTHGTPGTIRNCKVGDYVITLGENCGAPNHRIVIEAKKARKYNREKAINELNIAKKNRQADIGIFVFAKGYAPVEMGDFCRVGHDFFVTADEQAINSGEILVFLDAAYKIVRSMIVASVRVKTEQIDWTKVRRTIESTIELVNHLSDLSTKAKTIQNSAESIQKTVDNLRPQMKEKLDEVLQMVSAVPLSNG